jgi:hypothetical protein
MDAAGTGPRAADEAPIRAFLLDGNAKAARVKAVNSAAAALAALRRRDSRRADYLETVLAALCFGFAVTADTTPAPREFRASPGALLSVFQGALDDLGDSAGKGE